MSQYCSCTISLFKKQEDSDLLVYSAACLNPFPIIFKLDRKTGTCNVITMNWLLHATLPSTTITNSNNTMNNLLRY